MPSSINKEASKNGNGCTEKIKQAYISRFTALCMFAAERIGDYEDARDIVNDVFLKLFQNPKLITDYETFPAYLYRSVANACKDYLKHNEIKRKYEEDASDRSDFFQLQENETPLFLLISKEKEIELLKAIDKLPDMCGKVLLNRLEGLKYKEISDKLNISAYTVRNLILMGTKKLRIHFEKNEN